MDRPSGENAGAATTATSVVLSVPAMACASTSEMDRNTAWNSLHKRFGRRRAEMATFGIVLPLNVCPSGRSILNVMTGTAAAGGSSFQTSAPPAAMLRSTTAAINNAVLKRERG
jgi:hypothetical protein